MNIVLSGMPGSGKTTIANEFRKLGKKVYDTDEEIVKSYGRIADIFANYGEEYFRDLESQAVEKLSALSDAIIATGGGCLLREKNAASFKKSGKIVYLRTSRDTLEKRLQGDTERPLLQGGIRERLDKLFKEREHIYQNTADIIVDTDGRTPEQIAQLITELCI